MANAKQNLGTKVQFLGGNNEYRIGASSMLIEHNEPKQPTARILIDDGAMFPPDWINYDSAIPDMRPYFENPYSEADKPIDAVFVTHCHEDHIGGLVFLAAAKFKLPPIYTSEYTANIIRQQMKNNNVPEEYIPQIEIIREGESLEIGDNMKISPFNVSHSTTGAMGFNIHTTYEGKDLFGGELPGDYHLDEAPLGNGFKMSSYKKFMQNNFVNCMFFDSTSSSAELVDEKGEREIPDFNKAYENTLREVQKHTEKQIFSPVIARSVQNLAIDLKVAAETGRTVLIASRGLRQAVKSLLEITRNKEQWVKNRVEQIKQEALKQQTEDTSDKKGSKIRKIISNEKLLIENVQKEADALSEMMRLSSGEMPDLEKIIFNSHDIEHTDIEKYLRKYPASQRYMIISGAFAEDKNGRKSTLVMISEQNKVTRDKDGHVKGKGQTGHPLFTADDNTLFFLRQRPIESINGPQHRALVARLQSLGSTVILNGDNIEERYQRTGHATLQETQAFHKASIENCKNRKQIEDGSIPLYNVAVHGDPEQLAATLKVLHQHAGKPMLCFNSDVLMFTKDGLRKEKGISFSDQEWLCVKAQSITGQGSNNLFIFDLCDHNLMQKEHLFTAINVQSGRREGTVTDHYAHKEIERAERMIEEEGGSISNAYIRYQGQNKKGQRPKVEELSYDDYLELQASTKKGKFNRRQRFDKRGKGR